MDKKDNDTHRLILERRKKLSKLKDNNNFYRNIFPEGQTCDSIIEMSLDEKILSNKNKEVVVNGRMMSKRVMGKSSFANVKDETGTIQFYVDKTDLNEEVFKVFKESDIGDIVHVSGYLFKTKTGELTIHVKNFEVVTKSLRPLPEKYHGLADQEIKYRKRYLDLICNDDTRNIFDIRFKAIRSIRNYFDEKGFIEVFIQVKEILSMTTDLPHIIRGSAGCSLVCYLMKITHMDPIKLNISLTRFMHEKREDLPDIDMDFPAHRRNEIYEKIFKRYRGRAARISNHVMFKEKSAIKEAIRKEGYHKFIPRDFDLEDIFTDSKQIERVLTVASELQGTSRCYSLHCGGIVIFKDKVPDEYFLKDYCCCR